MSVNTPQAEATRIELGRDGTYPLLLAGRFTGGEAADMEVVNPANGRGIGQVATASQAQIDAAVRTGRKAALAPGGWAARLPHERAAVLYAIADDITRNVDRIAELQMNENGKTRTESRGQALSAAGTFRYYAGVCESLGEEMPPARGDYFNITVYEPLGVVAALTPWNSPLTMAAQKIAPALAAGNAMVLKPAETTSLVTLALADCCVAAGLPDGLLSVLLGGRAVGEGLVNHPQVDCISFTGGTETGQAIARGVADRLIPLILELGGKSPHIVFADADLPAAAKAVASGIFGGTGQSCVAGSRLFVEASAVDAFRELLIAEAEKMVVAPPDTPEAVIGPLASFAQRDRVESYVKLGLEEGAAVTYGGKRPEGPKYAEGAYYLPTILENLDNSARVAQEEIFGPVLCMMTFSDEADLIAQANNSAYGLACGIWIGDYKRAWRVARGVEAGTVWINTYKQLSIAAPFGGFKMSGLGREKGIQGVRSYQQSKSIYWGL